MFGEVPDTCIGIKGTAVFVRLWGHLERHREWEGLGLQTAVGGDRETQKRTRQQQQQAEAWFF